jgi:hypothetical protein
MWGGPAGDLLRSGYALPAAAACALGLVYFLLVSAALTGRLRLRRRPAEAPLITADGPPLGERIPARVMDELARQVSPAISWGNGRRLTVVFAAAGCAPCVDLLPHLAPAARRWRRDSRLIVVLETGGLADSHPAIERWSRLPLPVVRDAGGHLGAALGIQRRPLGLLLDPLGVTLMKGVVSTAAQLDALIQEWGVPIGQRAWKAVGESA